MALRTSRLISLSRLLDLEPHTVPPVEGLGPALGGVKRAVRGVPLQEPVVEEGHRDGTPPVKVSIHWKDVASPLFGNKARRRPEHSCGAGTPSLRLKPRHAAKAAGSITRTGPIRWPETSSVIVWP